MSRALLAGARRSSAYAGAAATTAPEEKIGRRLLAIDQGSVKCGVALFEGDRVLWTRLLAPSAGWPWDRRMRWITDVLRAQLSDQGRPDVVAIEDIVVWRNTQTALSMGETRGWLLCALEHWYPGIRQMAINPASVRSAAGAPRARAGALKRYRLVAEHVYGAPVGEDESAAICIGLAAIAELRHEELLTRAGIRPTPKLRRRRVRPLPPANPQLVLGSV